MLLAAGADPSHRDKEGTFPLYFAVQQSETLAIARALVEAKADINAVVERRLDGTPLFAAVRHRQKAMVKLLIASGCDLSKRSGDGFQPLTCACKNGYRDIAEVLLDAGADVNGLNFDSSTALENAARFRQCGTVKLLCERGAWLDHKGWHGRSAVYVAVEKGFSDVIKLLSAAGANLDVRDDGLHAPLHFASQLGECECVRALLCGGANIAAIDSQGRSPLHTAALNCHADVTSRLCFLEGLTCISRMVKVTLLSRDAFMMDTHSGERMGPPAAAASGDIKAVKLLLEAGSDPNALDENGQNALFGPKNVDIVRLLLDRGASVKTIDRLGCSPLHIAAALGANAGVLCLLHKAGNDPTLLSESGHTAADAALMYGHPDAAKMLELLAAKHQPSAVPAAKASCRQAVKEGELAKEPVTAACKFVDTDGRMKIRFLSDFKREEKRKKEEWENEVMNAFDKVFSKEEHAVTTEPEGICLHCDKFTDRKCSGCGTSYFCSRECEVAARFVCCG